MMPTRLPAQALRLEILLCLLTLSFTLPAHAGHWVITYEQSGQDVGKAPQDLPWDYAASGTMNWPSTSIYGGGGGFSPYDNVRSLYDSMNSNGSVTPVFTWTPDSSTDTSQPPATLYVLVYSDAEGYGAPEMGSPSANDGFGDTPSTFFAPGDGGERILDEEETQASGSHLVQVSTQGQTVVRLQAISLSASGSSDVEQEDSQGTALYGAYTYVGVIATPDNRGLSIQGPLTATKVPATRANDNDITYDGNGDENFTTGPTKVDTDGTIHGDIGLDFAVPGSAGDEGYSQDTITYTGSLFGSWGNHISHDNWFSSLKQSAQTDEFLTPFSVTYLYPIPGNPPTLDDINKTDHIFLRYTDEDDALSATANYYLTIHPAYDKAYTDHTQDMIDESSVVEFKDEIGPIAGQAGDYISVTCTVPHPWTVSFHAGDSIPLEWLGLNLGVDVNVTVNGNDYGATAGSSDTQAGDYSYPEVVNHYTYHYGKQDHWGQDGYEGTVAYQAWVPGSPPHLLRIHRPFGNAMSGNPPT